MPSKLRLLLRGRVGEPVRALDPVDDLGIVGNDLALGLGLRLRDHAMHTLLWQSTTPPPTLCHRWKALFTPFSRLLPPMLAQDGSTDSMVDDDDPRRQLLSKRVPSYGAAFSEAQGGIESKQEVSSDHA